MTNGRIFKRKSNYNPEDIFNPRGQYNEEMYISRPVYERHFQNALKTDMCILVQGYSGTGKTWLTRNVLKQKDNYYKVVNLALASSKGSIEYCFKTIMANENWKIYTKYSESKKASVKIPVAEGGLDHTKEFENNIDYFNEFLKFMSYRSKHSKNKKYIVFENFEAILSQESIIRELTNLITLVDDDEISKFNTKFIIIGAAKEIQKYFLSVPHVNTLDNRIIELPEIGTLTTSQAEELFVKGFDKLDVYFEEDSLRQKYIEKVKFVTGGIPQRLHEFCLELSTICAENNWVAQEKYLQYATENWIMTSLNKNYASLLRIMSHDYTVESRTNQVLYCISLKEREYFSVNEIMEDVIFEFPISTKGKEISITSIMNKLCDYEPPLLVLNDYTKDYSFADNKYALCLRSMLYKDGEFVRKYDFKDI